MEPRILAKLAEILRSSLRAAAEHGEDWGEGDTQAVLEDVFLLLAGEG